MGLGGRAQPQAHTVAARHLDHVRGAIGTRHRRDLGDIAGLAKSITGCALELLRRALLCDARAARRCRSTPPPPKRKPCDERRWADSPRAKTMRETTMRDRTLSETFALELMREGKLLMKMHTPSGMRWFVVPGGQITDAVATRILARPDVQPHDSGLFPGCEQTFQLRGDWRGRRS
jgi:hypothetical protein